MQGEEDPLWVLLDLPDALLLEILALMPRPHAPALACKRLCRLVRSSIQECDVLCAWPQGQHSGIPGLLRSMPRLSRFRLQDVPDWITHDAAALGDLLAARQDSKAQPGVPLWLAFCMRAFTRMHRRGQRQPMTAFARNCNAEQDALPVVPRILLLLSIQQVGTSDGDLRVWNNRLGRVLNPWGPRQLGAWELQPLASRASVQHLELAGHAVDGDGARWLVRMTQLRRLGVDVEHLNITAETLGELAALTNLQSLNLGLCAPGAVLGGALYQTLARLTQLQHLELGHANLANKHIQALTALTELTSLGLPGGHVQDPGAAELLSRLPHLQRLNLSNIQVGEAGMASIGRLTALRCLHLGWSRLDGQRSLPLQHLTRLEALAVPGSMTAAVPATVHHIASHLTTLRDVNLGECLLTAASIAALTGLRGLTSLNLQGNPTLGANGVSALSQLITLQSLSLARTKVGAGALHALSVLPQLQHLDVAWNCLTPEGARALQSMTFLRRLGVSSDQMEPANIELLSPMTSLQHLDVWQEGARPGGQRVLEVVFLELRAGRAGMAEQVAGMSFVLADLETQQQPAEQQPAVHAGWPVACRFAGTVGFLKLADVLQGGQWPGPDGMKLRLAWRWLGRLAVLRFLTGAPPPSSFN